MKITISFITIFLLLSCTHKVEFYRLDIPSPCAELDTSKQKVLCKFEYFVVANPPVNSQKLRSTIDSFNQKTLQVPDTLLEFRIVRLFYKETNLTPRTYKEHEIYGGYFNRGRDEIGGHNKDKILEFSVYRQILTPSLGVVFIPDSEIGKIYQITTYSFFRDGIALDKNFIRISESINPETIVAAEEKKTAGSTSYNSRSPKCPH